jgi:hypothetical protein
MIYIIIFGIEFILSILMEFTHLKYSNLSDTARLIWRFAMIVPLVLFCFQTHSTFSTVIMAILTATFVADFVNLLNPMGGMISFAIIHVGIAVAFAILCPVFNVNSNIIAGVCILIGITSLLFIAQYIPNNMFVETIIYILIIMIAMSRVIIYADLKNNYIIFVGYLFFFLCDYEIALMRYKGSFQGDQILNNIFYYVALAGLAGSTIL